MKAHAFWITAIALCLAACGEQQQAEPQPPESSDVTEPAAEPDMAEAATAAVDQAFIDHMHAHAEQLDELMFALADDDLEGAMTPAFWLSRHDTVEGVPEEWQVHVSGMREAALAVGRATDLESARAAAEEISANCQACHSAAGVAGPE
jgi:cytochrome c556